MVLPRNLEVTYEAPDNYKFSNTTYVFKIFSTDKNTLDENCKMIFDFKERPYPARWNLWNKDC